MTPTNGQETLTDLSDPGLGGKVSARFSTTPRTGSIIDLTNPFNGLTPDVQILDQTFARVPGQPSLDPLTQTFSFAPAGNVLGNAQYTLTLTRFVNTTSGSRLNEGVEDFSSSWTVGADIYPPVIRNTTPAVNQNEVPLLQDVVITFNESLDASTVVLGQTFFIEDGGTNPPTPLLGTLSLKRDGFDVRFRPDPCVGMPSATTVVVRMLAQAPANGSYFKDRVGNGLVQQGATGQVQFQFNTKSGNVLPDPTYVPHPGSRLALAGGPAGDAVFASSFNHIVALDSAPVLRDLLFNGTFRPELVQQILLANVAPRNWRTGAWGSFSYRADWDVKLGRVGEGIVDWRYEPTLLHTYLYVIDESDESIAIINSGNGKIEGRLKGVGSPRGITMTGPYGSQSLSPEIFVSNFGRGTVTGLPMSGIQAGQAICTAVTDLNVNRDKRAIFNVGRAPGGIAAEWYGSPFNIAAVANTADDSITVFDTVTTGNSGTGQATLSLAYQSGGEGPFDVAWSPYVPGAGIWCWIAHGGGAQDEDGSVSLWWNNAGGFIFTQPTGSILATLQDKIKNPGKIFQDVLSLDCYVPNTSGETVTTLQVNVLGSVIFTTIQPAVKGEREVGPNPTKVTFDPRFGRIAFVALAGSGQVAMYDINATVAAPPLLNVPGVRGIFSFWDQ